MPSLLMFSSTNIFICPSYQCWCPHSFRSLLCWISVGKYCSKHVLKRRQKLHLKNFPRCPRPVWVQANVHTCIGYYSYKKMWKYVHILWEDASTQFDNLMLITSSIRGAKFTYIKPNFICMLRCKWIIQLLWMKSGDYTKSPDANYIYMNVYHSLVSQHYIDYDMIHPYLPQEKGLLRFTPSTSKLITPSYYDISSHPVTVYLFKTPSVWVLGLQMFHRN
jgi:hypothetical protein